MMNNGLVATQDEIADRLRRAIQNSEMSQSDLAKRVHRVRSTVSQWVTGTTSPDLVTFSKICRELDISADHILDTGLPNRRTGVGTEGLDVRLLQALAHRGMTQRDLADQIGSTEQAVSKWISGKSWPKTWERFGEVCRALGVSADWLLGLEERDVPGDPEIESVMVLLSMASRQLERYAGVPRTDEELIERLQAVADRLGRQQTGRESQESNVSRAESSA